MNANDVAGLKGMKYIGDIRLMSDGKEIARETGEILFSENGVSGIAAMQLSMHATELFSRGKKVYIVMSPLPMTKQEAYLFLTKRAKAFSGRTMEEFLTGVVVKRIAQAAFKRAGIAPLSKTAAELTSSEIDKAARELTEWTVPVTGIGGFDVSQVMLGGVNAREFDENTMESRLVPGLYATGELLDVTGPCGGYNLAWAWASGVLAGRSALTGL